MKLLEWDVSIKRVVGCLAGCDLQDTFDFTLCMRIILM